MAKKAKKARSKIRNRAGKALYEFFHAAEAAAKAWNGLSKEERAYYKKAAVVARKVGKKKRPVKQSAV